MPWIPVEKNSFEFLLPDGWRLQNANVIGCGTVMLLVIGVSCLVGAGIDRGWNVAALPDFLTGLGLFSLFLAAIIPTAYVVSWFRTPEMQSGLPRLLGDLRGRGVILKGPRDQWMHLTAEPLQSYERPMDRIEMEEAFLRRYQDRVLEQGWLAGSGSHGHWGIYRLGGGRHKKYTIYLRVAPDREIEIVLTAKLNEPPEPSMESEYDAVARSFRPR